MTPHALSELIGGGLALLFFALLVVFCGLLIIAPVMIWRWSKRTCAAVESLRLSVISLEKSMVAAHNQGLSELRIIREAAKSSLKAQSPAVVPPPIKPSSATAAAVCPECGGVFEFDAKVSEVDVLCPSCHKPFHIH